MKKLFRHYPLWLAALLAVFCCLCLWRSMVVSDLLHSQQAAERWRGGNTRDFSQLSFFLPSDQKLSLDQLYTFRNDMAKSLRKPPMTRRARPGSTATPGAPGPVKVSLGRQNGEVQAFAVGGYFFDFHPLRLLSGNYLTPQDVMDDRVLLDRETAWLLPLWWPGSMSTMGIPSPKPPRRTA